MLGVDEAARGGAHGAHEERQREMARADAAQLEQRLGLPPQQRLTLEDVRRAQAGRCDSAFSAGRAIKTGKSRISWCGEQASGGHDSQIYIALTGYRASIRHNSDRLWCKNAVRATGTPRRRGAPDRQQTTQPQRIG